MDTRKNRKLGEYQNETKKIWISVIASMLIGTVSVAASSGIELFEILYLIFDYPHKHYTFKYFEV